MVRSCDGNGHGYADEGMEGADGDVVQPDAPCSFLAVWMTKRKRKREKKEQLVGFLWYRF